MSIEGAAELAQQLRVARSEGGAFRLPLRLLVRLSGSDAFRYLNGQVTRDLGRLRVGEALPSCLLTPKGKLCATLLIRREVEEADGEGREGLIVESSPGLQESLPARLERYIVADDVTVTIEPDPGGVHLFGKFAMSELWARVPGITVERLGVPGRDISSPAGDSDVMLPLLDPRVVEVLRIERRIPLWGTELTGETLPPEARLDLTHIDYDRGCYPGQEVISRLKSIGRVNKILQLLTVAGEYHIPAGTRLVNEKGERIGAITSAAVQFDTGSSIALGYLPRVLPEAIFVLDPLTGCRTPISIMAANAS